LTLRPRLKHALLLRYLLQINKNLQLQPKNLSTTPWSSKPSCSCSSLTRSTLVRSKTVNSTSSPVSPEMPSSSVLLSSLSLSRWFSSRSVERSSNVTRSVCTKISFVSHSVLESLSGVSLLKRLLLSGGNAFRWMTPSRQKNLMMRMETKARA